MRTIGLLISILLLAMSCGSSSSKKWDGTWSTTEGKIVVTLNSETMKADVKITLDDEPITYTSKWEYIDDGVVYFDYAPNQATIIKNDGSVYGFNTRTGQITDRGIKMHKSK